MGLEELDHQNSGNSDHAGSEEHAGSAGYVLRAVAGEKGFGEKDFGLSHPEETGMSVAELIHAQADIPSPFMKNIFLLRQVIVGTRYVGGSDELVGDLKPGCRITFLAEPDNAYDKYAVMALDSRGRKLGYIPRHENKIIGALLKAGKYIYGILPDKQPVQGMPAPGTERTPYSIWVDLYMREFLLPDDMVQIPRQGYQGSYVATDFILWNDEENDEENDDARQISSIFAIKVINGEERDVFRRFIGREDPEAYREAIAAFQRFAGYLPLVSHDITEEVLPQLEEAYGVVLGMPFSNHVIDTLQMAANHMPWVRHGSLDRLADELGIEVNCDTREETRCRTIWKLYIRMERSELEKKPKTSGKRETALWDNASEENASGNKSAEENASENNEREKNTSGKSAAEENASGKSVSGENTSRKNASGINAPGEGEAGRQRSLPSPHSTV